MRIEALRVEAQSYPEKLSAERAAHRVDGVKAIAEEIKVRFASDPKTADHEIARRIVDMFSWNVIVPHDRIEVKVEHGWVTLTGTVDSCYQSGEARLIAGRINGVIGVDNRLEIKRLPLASDVKFRIMDAFKRQANLDAANVTVATEDSTVTLTGRVKSWNERNIAERAAWAAPGVNKVEDRIVIAL